MHFASPNSKPKKIMRTRLQDNLMKGVFFVALSITLLLQSLLTHAQSRQWDSQNNYKGFVASFGGHSATLSSSIGKIHQSNLQQTGGQVGLIFGNDLVRTKTGLLGYYSSAGNTAGTTDLYTSNIAFNFYPLSRISNQNLMVEPYITTGLNYDRYKFYGYYLNQEPGLTNYSQSEAPYLGKIKQVNATAGLGIEVKLRDHFDFIHLFTEFTFGHNLSTKTSNSAFNGTETSRQTQLVLGITFGAHRGR